MPTIPTEHPRPTHSALHPRVYRTIVALTIWLVFSIWVFFSNGAYVGLTSAMITVFFVVVVGIPLLIWKTWQHNAPRVETRPEEEPFETWKEESFATRTGSLTGRSAAIQILTPIAAVSIGMFVFGLVYYFDIPHIVGY